VHKDYRKVVVRHFPFIIIFEYDENEIRIWGVFHSGEIQGNIWNVPYPKDEFEIKDN